MGRKARTNNCSPVDAVLEKYHNDIGNRLSGVFIPPQTTDTTEGLVDDFCMLTLNFKRASSLKYTKPNRPFINDVNKKASTLPCDILASKSKPIHSVSTSSSKCTTDAHNRDQDSAFTSSKDKVSLVDKLTRALFQKRHICARCRRKSRSCIVNKTISLTEKRYTCGRCRENSSALKNIFDKSTDGPVPSNSSLSSSSSPAFKRDGSGLPQPRLCNDSGYETVTSCSTVASSYSAFNTSKSTKQSSTKDNCTSSEQSSDSSLDNRNQIQTQEQNAPTHAGEHADFSVCSPNLQRCPAGRVPHTYEYDGYLPDFIEYRGWNRHQTDAQACDQAACVPHGCADDEEDDDEPRGGVMIVRKPTPAEVSSVPSKKACHTCGSTTTPCFRLPWEGGWLCENCMDGLY